MIKSHRTQAPRPDKPTPDFPLFPHAAGVWAKKIRGKLHYFGPWDDPQGALAKYNEQKEALHAGKKPRETAAGAATIKDVVNSYLNARKASMDAGELSPLTFRKYKVATDEMISHFGRSRLASDADPADFAALRNRMAAKWGPLRLSDMVQNIRSVFKHAFEAGLLAMPVRFGPDFKKPSKKSIRLHRAHQGPKLFTAGEIRAMIAAAPLQLKAMILLGINCGFGNSDCGNLPLTAVDLDGAMIDYPRPKTGIARRCPLWPETVEAIRAVLAVRKQPKDKGNDGLVFINKNREAWAKVTGDDPVWRETAVLLKKLGINGRHRLGFYALRHVFRTVADETRDQPACDFIMGHEVPHMSSIYRETISDARLKAVADYVHAWLFPSSKEASAATEVAGEPPVCEE
jgi:integrase